MFLATLLRFSEHRVQICGYRLHIIESELLWYNRHCRYALASRRLHAFSPRDEYAHM